MNENRYINLKGDKLILGFKFDPKIVQAVRLIDGRVWNAKEKQWEIPAECAEEALRTLEPLGFTPHIQVKEYIRKQAEAGEELVAIKNSVDQPYTGKLPLYDFQRKGAAFLKKMPSALLADVPGLGKSIQTLAATEDEAKVLIFCPASLKYSWKAEIEKWIPEAKMVVVDGNKEERTSQWMWAKDPKYKYAIANYELLLHDFEEIKDFDWPVIVTDEATRIANPAAKTTGNLKALRARKRLALTGTPISNTPEDIWSVLDWVAPRYLGTFYQFREKYCVTEPYYGRVVGFKDLDALKEKVDRYMLRRTKEEVFKDFPPKTIENIIFPLPEKERNFYQAIKEQVVEEVRKLMSMDTRTLGIIPVKMLRLKQATDHTKLVGGYGNGDSTKMETLKELLKPIIDSGEKAIIFTQFAEMLHIMRKELEDWDPLCIYGDVDTEERMVRVKEFNDDPKKQVIIMTEAGAYGLNMQSASYVFHYDLPWSVAKLTQREDRAHRIGNKKPVTVYNLIAKDTIDEYVLKILTRKNKVSVDILKDAERLEDSGLSMEDIKAILRL